MAVLSADTPDLPLADTRDVSKFLAQSINQLLRGQLDSKVDNALGYVASVLLRSLGQGRLEERLANLEGIVSNKVYSGSTFEFRSSTAMEDKNGRQDATAPIDRTWPEA